MKYSELLGYCLSKKGAYIDHPFGPESDIIKVEGKTKNNNGSYQYSVPWYESSNDFINFSLVSSGFRIHAGSNNAGRGYELTIYYTKTND